MVNIKDIPCVILAGGFGTRLTEETINKPKPLVEIGQFPIIWHIMKLYSYYGVRKFIISCGYKSHLIKDFFLNYQNHANDILIDLQNDSKKIITQKNENWKIILTDTGINTNTGGRILNVKKYLKEHDLFFCTYGDGVSNINLNKLLDTHLKHKKIATLSAVKPYGRFGELKIEKSFVKIFQEKINIKPTYINGGFFIFSNKIFKFIKNQKSSLEEQTLTELSKINQLVAYKHQGFWSAMDNVRDMKYLNELWNNNKAQWKIWK